MMQKIGSAVTLTLVLCGLAVAADPKLSERDLARISKEVRHELVGLPYYGIFDNLSYNVDPTGAVTLQGQVTRPTLKTQAERVIRDIEGVPTIVNQIEVLPLSASDDRIRLAIFRAIYGNAALNRYALQAVPSIHIVVKNGDVTLEGVVANEGDKNNAGIQANTVAGIHSVKNNIRIEKD